MIARCSNKYCYITDILLTVDKISVEHIIPNSLGGFLKCPDLVCKEVNNDQFAKLDAMLSKSIELAQLIKFKRDRDEQPSIIGTSTDGLQYSVNNLRQGKLLQINPHCS